ncbi:MAG: response regulator [Deltaproteobacteria bacterium]|nr:response regulator [Deltaproteobacteria bacterium]
MSEGSSPTAVFRLKCQKALRQAVFRVKGRSVSEAIRKSILVVDDAQENIDVLKEILKHHYTVMVATSGRLALKAAFSPKPPDLILLDVMMPDMDGHEVCRLLKADERTRNIPVIFVTARSEMEDEIYGFSIGAEDYIIKPVSAPTVLARIKTHLALYDRSRHLEGLVQDRTADLLAKSRELEETRLEITRCLGRAAEYRDNETGMHVIRLGFYVRLLACKAGLTDVEADQMMSASIMHDIGKIGIPDNILLKPAKLVPEEFEVIKQHAQIGADIIGEQTSELLQLSRLTALTHHEKWNGKGYPLGLKGEAIPLVGRLTAIADIFDALTSARPYKEAWDVDKALDWIQKEAGETLDPKLVPLFIELRQEVEEIMQTLRD